MSERELKLKIIEQAEEWAKILLKGKHIEVHKSNDGIKAYTVDKKITKQTSKTS